MNYDVKIIRENISALFDLKGDKSDVGKHLETSFKSFPKVPNTFVCEGNWKLMYLGENHWILKAPIEDEDHLISILKPESLPPEISIVLISDTLTFFSVVGPNAFDIMSIATPLNLNGSAFSNENTTFGEVFGLKALISRIENGFQFAIDQSFGDMIADYLDKTLAK
jgi:sarcosine oxidase subunit gamma